MTQESYEAINNRRQVLDDSTSAYVREMLLKYNVLAINYIVYDDT